MLHGMVCCTDAALCEICYPRELLVKARQAAVIGQCWAERVARRREYRGLASWPVNERVLAIAARLVASLATDQRMVGELAKACVSGASAWWARRPEGYR